MMKAFITALGITVILSAPAQSTASPQEPGLFGSLEIASGNLSALPQWQRSLAGFDKLREASKRCDEDILKCDSQQMTLWRTKIQELEHSDRSIAMRQINSFINKWQHIADQDLYKQSDYWATPLEFITNGGDSEDFAIMKYVSLRELGFSADQMRIVVTNDVLRGVTHTVLSVKLSSKSYILDSQNDTVLREEFVNYYVPYYSVNENTRWAHIPSQFSQLGDAAGAKQ
ncbi:transglutaminase-like cysteine peptidase [Sneathiella glossodoripedis]|uniref:transglutaminase-like cysteine peptidase n=1 Tax=Sneathiella glossodoripedis TaxID=418853 RepID=UPI000A00566A|nr:transglutaminase-like cysteine peptidase [Sneathiella glossodoripedis]